MDKLSKIRLINATLRDLSLASLQAPRPATAEAIAYWQAALKAVVGQ